MGLFSSILGAAAPIVGSIFGGPAGGAIGSLVGGALASSGGSSQSGTQTQTTQQQLDPRIQSMLFGDGTSGNQGLLSQYQGYLNQPQGAGTTAYGNAAQNYLQNNAAGNLGTLQGATNNLLNSNVNAPQSQAAQSQAAQFGTTPQVQAAQSALPQQFGGANMVSAQSQGSQINAPSQNNTDLSGAYSNFINGNAGSNPYLNSALQAGVDATNAGYSKNVNTLTDTLQKSVLPGIRSSSVLAGQYGGTRQGIAEGNAISDYTKQLNDNNAQLAATNSANTIGAQAQAFNSGQDRSLSALQGLSGQQYGVAGQNAALQQQNNISNAQLQNQTGLQVSGNQQQAILAYQQMLAQGNQQNASLQQQANLANQNAALQVGSGNQSAQQQTNLANQSAQQQTGLANQQAQLSTNGLNSQNQLGGIAGLSGLLASQYGVAQNQDNSGINRATQVNGLLAPYLSSNSSQTTSSPLYQNQGANILGGATAGLGLYNGIKNAFGTSSTGTSTSGGYVPPWGAY